MGNKPIKRLIINFLFLFSSFVFSGTSFPQDLTITSDTTLEPGTYTYDNVLITNGATLTFNGAVTLNAINLTLDTTSSISADAKGYPAGEGPGSTGNSGYSGAGYGGKGGRGYSSPTLGGPSYGSSLVPTDLGSGGGSSTGFGSGSGEGSGSGGGAIRLNLSHSLILNGKITANGSSGISHSGGGSGGSIYIIASSITGSGALTANGSSASSYGGGGGGGRIAVYYQTSTFSGTALAKGGIAPYPNAGGEDGTVVFQGPSLDTPLTAFILLEKSSTLSTSQDTFSTQTASASSIAISGTLNGTLNFTALEFITITSGSFAGKGFSKGEFAATLDGVSYASTLKGVTYLIPSENKLYLKGEIEGELNGICEGYLSESTPGSQIYDKFQAAWKINKLKTEPLSATLNLVGTITYQPAYNFTSEIYLYQTNYEGSAFGSYTGPLTTVITRLYLSGESTYKGEGFSIISYNTALGQGQAYSYNKQTSAGATEFQGLFESPLSGKLTAILDETKSPKILSGVIEKLDLGATPQPELKVKVWGPTRVSPGQTVTYLIEYRNDGLKAAGNVFISAYLDTFEKYVYASPGVSYSPYAHRLSWKIPTLAAKASGLLSFQTEIIWGLSGHTFLNRYVFITDTGE